MFDTRNEAGDRAASTEERYVALIAELASLDLSQLNAEALGNGALARVMKAQEVAATKLASAATKVTKVWDERRIWADDGARTAATWLSSHTTLDPVAARGRVRLGIELDGMPATRAAFDEGTLSAGQVGHLAKVAGKAATADAFAAAEEALVAAVIDRSAAETGRVIETWKHRNAARVAERESDRRRRRREVRMWEDPLTGMGHIHAELHPEAYAKARNTLQRLLDVDWTHAHRRGPDGQQLPPDERTFGQRRADAFLSMVDRAHSTIGAESDFEAPRKQLNVNVSYETLVERAPEPALEIGSGQLLTGEIARRLACAAGISRHITKGASVLLDKGRTVYAVSGAQRQAVLARDGGCNFPSCDAPPEWCDVHHADPFNAGAGTGRTDIGDLVSVCGAHHELVHEGGWVVEGIEPGVDHQTWVSPSDLRLRARHRGLEVSTRPRPGAERALPTQPSPPADERHRQLALVP